MFDSTAVLVDNAAHGTLYAVPAAVLAGLISSAGPCLATRCIALTALCSDKPHRTVAINTACFVSGVVLAYVLFGSVAAIVAKLLAFSSLTYAILALFLAVSGIRMLWHDASCCAPRSSRPAAGGAVLSGMAISLVPCASCTPIVLSLLSLTGATGSVSFTCALLASFAVGHCVPLCMSVLATRGCRSLFRRRGNARAAGVIAGSITLAMSGYYAILI